MATVTKCDRCGKECEPEKERHWIASPASEKFHKGRCIGVIDDNGEITERFDLCERCFGKLFNFIDGEEAEG